MTDNVDRRTGFRRFLARALGVAAIFLVSMALALLTGELVIRMAAPQQVIQIRPDLWQPADSVGYLHQANAAAPMNTGERTVTVYTDAEGMRVGAQGRKNADTRVLLLGDSFMEALQVEYEASTAGLLEKALQEGLGRDVAVRNAAVVGWDPNHYAIRARQLLARDTFALVVVSVFVGNDAVSRRLDRIEPRAPVARHKFHLPRELSTEGIINAFFGPVNDLLETRSHLFVLLKNQAALLRMRLGLTQDYFPDEFRKSEAVSSRWTVTADLLTEIERAASAHGTPTIFALVPAPFQVHSTDFDGYVRGLGLDPNSVDLDQPSRLLEQEMRARGLRVVNALAPFREVAETSPRLYGRVDNHFTPEGHRQLTALLAPLALQLLAR